MEYTPLFVCPFYRRLASPLLMEVPRPFTFVHPLPFFHSINRSKDLKFPETPASDLKIPERVFRLRADISGTYTAT